jgi:hypothetical protein
MLGLAPARARVALSGAGWRSLVQGGADRCGGGAGRVVAGAALAGAGRRWSRRGGAGLGVAGAALAGAG